MPPHTAETQRSTTFPSSLARLKSRFESTLTNTRFRNISRLLDDALALYKEGGGKLGLAVGAVGDPTGGVKGAAKGGGMRRSRTPQLQIQVARFFFFF